MEIKKIDLHQLPTPSLEFKIYLDSYLDLCKFNEEEKLGILFYMGATLPGRLNDVTDENDAFDKYLKVLSLYSKSTGDFSDYGDLNDTFFSSWIYNANLAISKICADESSIDDNLRILPVGNIIVGKEDPNIDFLANYEFDSFNLNTVQNFNDQVFCETGKHLLAVGYSYSKAYEAGFAYRMMMLTFDVKGTHYLLTRISSFLSPLFETIFYTPFLFVFNYNAFKSNHLFSQILNNFYGGINSKIKSLVQPIHSYHQFLFYRENSSELRDEWLFGKDSEEGSAISIFLNAINIRKTKLVINTELIKSSGEVFDSSLIDVKIERTDFLKAVLKVLRTKYSIHGHEEFVNVGGVKWSSTWNNKGDYIQFLVILYYETCLHALVVDDLI